MRRWGLRRLAELQRARAARRGRRRRSGSAWVPCSTMRPSSITMIRSAARTVARRWAMTIVVRSSISRSSASWTSRSLSASSAEVASSSSSSGASRSSARAIAIRWRWPPGQPRAALAEIGVEALAAARAGIRRRWRPRRRPTIASSRGLPSAVAQIVARRGGEDHRLLRHDRDARAELRRIGLAAARRRRAGPRPHRDRRSAGRAGTGRLAGARRPDHRHRLARRDVEREIVRARRRRAGSDSGR